jgi:hypothetical protein
MKIKICVSIGFVCADRTKIVEIPNSELDGLSGDEIENYIYKNYVDPFIDECVDCGYEVIED